MTCRESQGSTIRAVSGISGFSERGGSWSYSSGTSHDSCFFVEKDLVPRIPIDPDGLLVYILGFV